jgi:Polysaccharide deacetylase
MRSLDTLISTLLLAFLMVACIPGSTLPLATETASQSPLPADTSTPTSTDTATLTLSPTITRTPPVLPSPYQADLLYEGDTPHTYITDTCQYLRDRWASTSAAPGTVVMVIMFHYIVDDDTVPDPYNIRIRDFHLLMGDLMNNGFEAITTLQLADFMEHNSWIPERSVLLVVDDRKSKVWFDLYFREYWEADGWPVVNAYISAERDGKDALNWIDQEILNAEGWVDYQAHGVVHNIPMAPGVSDEYITSELEGSIDAFQLHFGKSPIAIIWPGGNFFKRPVEIARQLGYRLGFTVNPRGPLMYNWVPLADEVDPRRPTWIPEGTMDDPLLVLPRYWPDAALHIPDVVQVNLDASAYAEANRASELDYYDIVCSPTYGPLP